MRLVPGVYVAFAVHLFTQPLLAGTPKIELTDPKAWSDEQKQLMEKAADLAINRMAATQVAKCAFRNAWRGVPSRDKWAKDMAILRRYREVVITIGDGVSAKHISGEAKVGVAQVNARQDGWLNLAINLNKERINYYQKETRYDEELWANVIAHELAHNMGYTHGSGRDFEENYAGYFVTEMGFCVATDGRDGSDRGNADLRRERVKRFNIKW